MELIKGDLSKVKADALVNAAGTSLKMGGGVAGALKREGGIEIELEALKHAPPELGRVIVTKAGKLNARHVFHAAAQPHYGNFKATIESVKKATLNSLKKAEDLGCKSIAFPALGCGIAGLKTEKGAKAILETIRGFEKKAQSIELVKVVLFSEQDFEVFEREWTGKIPSEKECYKLLKENSVPKNIVRHSEKVKEFALKLAEQLQENGERVNLNLVKAGALLHDIDKIQTIKGKGSHGEQGYKKLKEKGFFKVAEIVKKHVLERVNELNSIEEKIVFYADKRVQDNKIVSLKERLEHVEKKYGSNSEIREKIVQSKPLVLKLERELMEKINN